MERFVKERLWSGLLMKHLTTQWVSNLLRLFRWALPIYWYIRNIYTFTYIYILKKSVLLRRSGLVHMLWMCMEKWTNMFMNWNCTYQRYVISISSDTWLLILLLICWLFCCVLLDGAGDEISEMQSHHQHIYASSRDWAIVYLLINFVMFMVVCIC